MLKERFNDIIRATQVACESFYRDRLVSLAVFGSTARGTMRPDSDVTAAGVDPPLGRLNRTEFSKEHVAHVLGGAERRHLHFLPMIKTLQEVEQEPAVSGHGGWARILVDADFCVNT
jgi:predicted nucleotidyltransferase